MFCKKCGKEIKEGAKFCTGCGTPVSRPVAPQPAEEERVKEPSVQPAKEERVKEPSVQPAKEEGVKDPSVPAAGEEDVKEPSVPAAREEVIKQPIPQKKKKRDMLPYILLGIIIILAVFIAGLLFYYISGQSDSRTDEEEAWNKEEREEEKEEDKESSKISATEQEKETQQNQESETAMSGETEPAAPQAEQETTSVPGNFSKIEEQSFHVNLTSLGEVDFVSYAPDKETNPRGDAVFEIQKNGQTILTLDGPGMAGQIPADWNDLFYSVNEVDFPDFNLDGYTDIVIICGYGDVYNTYMRVYSGNMDGTFYFEKSLGEAAGTSSHTIAWAEEQQEQYKKYVLPYSDSIYWSEQDIERMSDEKLRLARNEIYARHGYIFQDKELADYFGTKDWYYSSVEAVPDSSFNIYEKANLELIQREEEKRK